MILKLGSGIDLFVYPGEYEFADAQFRIRTTLGSCIAITMWHPGRQLGGMCHYMLPRRSTGRHAQLDGKYADEAIVLLEKEARRHGTSLDEYEIKLFGGGNMFPGRYGSDDSVAQRNIRMAYELMRRFRLNVKAESLGGVGYRSVIFEIATGAVWVRHVVHGPALQHHATGGQ